MSHVDADATRTYDVSLDAELPDLTGGTIASVASPEVTEAQTTYFDTGDSALAAAGISLHRRRGGPDPSWQLDLPAEGDTRTEIRRALGRGLRVPLALTRPLTAVTVGNPLHPKIVMATTRTSYDLVGEEGTVVATVSDDVVAATLPDGTPLRWREVGVAPVDGDQPVLDELHRVLEKAGITRTSLASQSRRALECVGLSPHGRVGESAMPRESAGAALHQYLVEQHDALITADLAVRSTGSSVHDLRVAARRIRTALTVYRGLVDEETARNLQGELQWIGRALSDVRDLEVAGGALDSVLHGEPDNLRAGRVRTQLRRTLASAERPAKAAAEDAIASQRYLTLLRDLKTFLAAPPWTDRASTRADKTLRKLLKKPHRRLRRASEIAAAAGPDERLTALHDVRKAAKRLRYSLEVAGPVLESPAERLGGKVKSVQSILGDHLDTVAASTWLRRLGHDPGAGQAAFTFGRLHARNEERVPDQLRAYERAVKRVLKRKWSRFLRTS